MSQYLRRTPGLKLYDVALYPLLTNFVVFGISVAATYLTNQGGARNPETGRLVYGKVGQWFHGRGEKMVNLFKKTGMSHDQADMSKMVFFSFFDGSLIAPFVKLLEDRRERIARSIDTKLGTLPADDSVYESEPKQTWGSVIGGRLLTCMIVVPTAVLMEKTGMNNVLFRGASRKVSNYISENPGLSRKLTRVLGDNVDIPEISRVGVFEGFYTSVCTAGLYVSSRCIAGVKNTFTRKHDAPENKTTAQEEHSVPSQGVFPAHDAPPQETQMKDWRERLPAKVPSGQFVDMAGHTAMMERS